MNRFRVWLIYLAGLLVFCAADLHSSGPPKNTAERLGYPANARLLVLHADDFGMMHSVDRATAEALQNHWITSASLMVPCPWFPEAARFARAHPDADVGVHLVLNSEWTAMRWRPMSPQLKVSSLVDGDGYFPMIEEDVFRQAKAAEVEQEARTQIESATAAGVSISHLDAHMGTIARSPALLAIYRALGKKYSVPILLDDRPADAQFAASEMLIDKVLQIAPGVEPSQWLNEYKKMLAPLPPGVYQLIVHLGYDDEELRGATADHPDWGARWRQSDFDLVRSPEFQQFLREQRFVLVSWRDLSRALQSEPSAPEP